MNGNFYGPAVLPPSKTHRRRRILCTILKVAIGFIVGIGIILLILGLVYRPTNLEFNVTNAKLTQFNITGNQLHYQLSLNISIRNPNKRYRVYYDTNEMAVIYKNRRLDTHWLPAFFQDSDSVAVLGPNNFEGQRLVFLNGDEIVEFNSEKSDGVYPIDVKIFLRLRMKSGGVVLKLKPKVYCGLKMEVTSLSNGVGSFFFFPNAGCHFSF